MDVPREARLLRVYTDETTQHGDHLLYEVVVVRARQAGLAGATVLRGRMGFGQTAHMRAFHITDLSPDLPVVIEIVDSEDKLLAFLPRLADLQGIGLVTSEKVEVHQYGTHRSGPSFPR